MHDDNALDGADPQVRPAPMTSSAGDRGKQVGVVMSHTESQRTARWGP